MSVPSPPPSSREEQLLDAPSWLGQEGYESATERWLLQHDSQSSEGSSDIETEDTDSHLDLKIFDADVRNVEAKTNQFSDTTEPEEEQNRITISGSSSSSEDAEVPYPFYLPSTPPSSRASSPGVGSSQQEETFFPEQSHYASLIQAQMSKEYEEVFHGPISNEEFLESLKVLDEHWGIEKPAPDTTQEVSPMAVWIWYEAYVDEHPDQALPLSFCVTEEEKEAMALEIQDEYLHYEERVDKHMEDALMDFAKSGGVRIDRRVLEVALVFQFLVKGKFRCDEDFSDEHILTPKFEDGEAKEAEQFTEKLRWYYKMIKGFFEGRFAQWLLNEVHTLVDLAKLEEGENLESLLKSEVAEWPGYFAKESGECN